jgi:hypothetical protein
MRWLTGSIVLFILLLYAFSYYLYLKDGPCRRKSIVFYHNCKNDVIEENKNRVTSEKEMKMLVKMLCFAQLRDTCWYNMEYVFDPSKEESYWPVIIFGPFLLLSQCEKRGEY